MQTSSEHCLALVQQVAKEYALSSRIYEAFLGVPRHMFLTPTDGVVSEQWLSEVYRNAAIITKQDQRGMPLSSSSQPSVMALMLDALDVQL